ncbi:MAG: tRNA dihydrouridine synthase DusB [Actinomycetaceae bacterium]|nr:tRNA dihydrouridine synthase DusB [Actinomycetaceae bacterium]MDY6083054.1 tRNA dihydrouridine synthase DusB [Actinomycetaceae bacterium]
MREVSGAAESTAPSAQPEIHRVCSPVKIGSVKLETPLILAPMAGVTDPPFRQLCREQAEAGVRDARQMRGEMGDLTHTVKASEAHTDGRYAPAGLWVCEMVTGRALVEDRPAAWLMVQPDPGDPVRSIQIYGTDPHSLELSARRLVAEGYADHIDLNFGCPVPKVTRKGGGSALPWKVDLLSAVLTAVVRGTREGSEEAGKSAPVPVTAKFRIGIDDAHTTIHDAVRACEDAGISALTVHGRTTAEYYGGHSHWDAIAAVVDETTLPVFGNGDVFEAQDALDMMDQTGCAGVAVGRGAQGRPWVFYDIAAALHGVAIGREPSLRRVAETIERHGELSIQHYGGDEARAMRQLRKHISWYLRGWGLGGQIRQHLAVIDSMENLRRLLASLPLDEPFPPAAHGKRGRSGVLKHVKVPEHWYESRTLSPQAHDHLYETEDEMIG